MSQVRIMVDVPESLPGESVDRLFRRATLLLVIDEVRAGRLTRPVGARLLDMALADFPIEAGRHGLYAIDYDEGDCSHLASQLGPVFDALLDRAFAVLPPRLRQRFARRARTLQDPDLTS